MAGIKRKSCTGQKCPYERDQEAKNRIWHEVCFEGEIETGAGKED